MSDTARLKLPLLQPSQAQKHVTVNEALTRLDGVVQLVLESRSLAMPPSVVVDGACYGVPQGAVNAWAGQDGRIAIGANGGWEFVSPVRGWRALIADEGVQAIHDGTAWRAGQVSLSPGNAGLAIRVVEIDHAIQAGTVSVTSTVIPAGAVVIGVTGRVIQDITGTASSWALGNPGASGRFGSGLGLSAGSWVRGVLGQPMAFYSPEPLQIEAEGGDFSGGVVRLAVHFMELALPDL
ncbi:uncharacterized protein DUF2793 [Albidovulum inexpectatum]|uniref:Uncharacterized protein DUF2793 n=1 Tax=Albidovulum inexpectatum TaxID=196587 RepID=A0A2S5JIQ1_9RHOB|nr:DUF2793 domain-containing protein [Albidovulum inexpectatum]PPB81310.1 uncharacterized protein DUF2793 [Albidovulum inexpectatum]